MYLLKKKIIKKQNRETQKKDQKEQKDYSEKKHPKRKADYTTTPTHTKKKNKRNKPQNVERNIQKITTFLNALSARDHPELDEIKEACNNINFVLSPSKIPRK